ncbi:MAG: N-acetyl-gamma-glutamyl-phosphate reductase [Methyloligella sp.]|nr:MAG: N-acetyl-gamma-glutamyl-phosphate reductase [Methyloligella sp.]
MTAQKIRTVIIGASGYTGGDFMRLAVPHENIELTGLVANTHAGKPVADVFPHLRMANLPDMVKSDDINWDEVDAAICGLPHGTAQDIISTLPKSVKVIDMSADFRLRDTKTYSEWYGRSHDHEELYSEVAYGLTEHNRDDIRKARIIACPGCYPTAVLMAMLPLVKSEIVETESMILNAVSGVSGAGRGLKQNTLFCETGEGFSPYAIGNHRHTPEIEQEINKAAGEGDLQVTFTPHLVPMSRGELISCYLTLKAGQTISDARATMEKAYNDEAFIHIAPEGVVPGTQHVRGSNHCLIGLFEGRVENQLIVISTIDNLVKGSAGQALQNFNLAFGIEEQTGLEQLPLFP